MRYELLAWSQTPAPRGTSYFLRDLEDAEKVIELFAYAHLSLARITREAWRFLWFHYGLEGLLALNRYAQEAISSARRCRLRACCSCYR